MNTAFLFPGQGAQTVGMGLDLYDYYTDYKNTFDECQRGSNKDLKSACFEGRGMDESETVQPAIFAHSISLFSVLKNRGVVAQNYAGLSLGEYSALCAAAVFSAEQGAALVAKRGGIMDSAFPAGEGGMLSVIGFTVNQVEKDIEGFDKADVANHLSDLQTVIAGKTKDLEIIERIFKQKGAKMVTLLDVKGPSHFPLLCSAAEQFRAQLNQINLAKMHCTTYSNVLGKPYPEHADIRDLLAQQMIKRVRWHECVEHMISNGVRRFVEIGPSAVLSKMLKRRLGKQADVYSVRDKQTLEEFLERY